MHTSIKIIYIVVITAVPHLTARISVSAVLSTLPRKMKNFSVYCCIFGIILFSTLAECAMPINGSLCSLIRATNLGQMANYGWSCADNDCSAPTTFALSPVSKGVCEGSQLVELNLINTNNVAAFQGTIPATFGEISAPLRSIQFQTNQLFGSIPFSMGEIHTTLSYFDISSNKLTGTIPSSFCDITSLTTLKFGNNDNLFCYAHCLSSIADLSPGAVNQCGKYISVVISWRVYHANVFVFDSLILFEALSDIVTFLFVI